jgi:ATP phosphoribosyltransferase regulatory subunit
VIDFMMSPSDGPDVPRASWADSLAPLPVGARDVLADACRRRQEVTRGLSATFDRWGYEPVSTPSIELYDVFGRGLHESERRKCVRFIDGQSGALVTLRSDVTPQIARLAGQHYADALQAGESVRLRYTADVVRHASGRGHHLEAHQLGVELLGDGNSAADAELIEMCCEALSAVGLTTFTVDLAHVGVAAGVLAGAPVDERGRAALRHALERKDEGAIVQLLAETEAAPALTRAIRALCSSYGPAAMLKETAAPLRAWAGGQGEVERGLGALGEVLDALARTGEGALDRVTVDLGEVRGFGYYSGLRVRVWAPGAPTPIVRGGRYDHLLERFGAASPAVGFAVDLDALERARGHAGRAGEVPRAHACLVALAPGPVDAATRAGAAAEAKRLRGAGTRSWVVASLSLARAQLVAARAGVESLVYLRPTEGGLERTCYSAGPSGWSINPRAGAALQGSRV